MRTRPRPSSNQDRKLAQLCAEAQDILSLALGDSTDSRLNQLAVHSVLPGPDASRLTVLVVCSEPLDFDGLERLHDALERARPWLRQQIAAELHRKRTPDLSFRVLPSWEESP